MKRITLLLLAVAGSLVYEPLNGCGPGFMSEDYRFWLLQPELAESRSLHSFYFTTDHIYETDDQELLEIGYQLNIAEWKVVVGNKVPEEAISTILYGTTPSDFWLNEQELFASNAFLKRLTELKGGWPEFIRYAKTCEQLANQGDPWGFAEHDSVGIRRAWTDGTALLKRATDPVLKARVAYQLVRIAHYGGLPLQDAEQVFDAHLAPLRGKTWLEPSAAFYLASMQPNPARDLAYADLLDRALDKRSRMVNLFVSGEVETYLSMATSDKQRASLVVMRDLQHPGRALEDLERIANWDPTNPHLPLLLSREVNKLEDWLLTPDLTDMGAAIRQWSDGEDGVSASDIRKADLDYLHQVKRFISRVTVHAAPKDQALMLLLNGHMSFICGDLDEARTLLGQVQRSANSSATVRAQARMDLILCGVMDSKQLTDATRNDVLALVELVNTAPELQRRRSVILDQLHLYLGKKLIERGELAEGAFLLARSERLYGTIMGWWGTNARIVVFEKATPTDYDRMIALLDKPDKSPFERYLTATDDRPADWESTEQVFKQTEFSREKLLDYKATWYLREDSLEAAATVFRQIPDSFWQEHPYAMFAEDDPFVVNIEDPHNYNNEDSVRYTKRTIVERMIALKREAERNPKKRALNHYLLGNAAYSMSWHGKYWIMSRIGWSMWEMSDWRDREVSGPGDADYFGCQRAQRYYELALEEAKDPILKAMACRMAWECRKNWWSFAGEGGMDEAENPFVRSLDDAKSRESYAAIEDCSGYAAFVARFR
ncbi:MAG: hypothetical protein IPN38_14000 [Flavobacteriales bacterium]|nr:hypothetical protein [Flavobacteriales bacterium]